MTSGFHWNVRDRQWEFWQDGRCVQVYTVVQLDARAARGTRQIVTDDRIIKAVN